MKFETLNLIEDVISVCGLWKCLEVSNDSLYLEFSQVQLFNDSYPDSSNLVLRFGENTFIKIYTDDKEYFNQILMDSNIFFKEFNFKVIKNEFKFQDIGYVGLLEDKYMYSKSLGDVSCDCDFILSFDLNNFGVCVGGDFLDFFNDFERLNESSILNLSNKWCVYYLRYWDSKNKGEDYSFDSICESDF